MRLFKVALRGILVASVALVSATAASAASSKHAAIVIDANTGKTLFSENADAPRYPASLTKMMTLYLVFEAINGRKITLQTRVPFSARAAAESPTKLGVKAGNSIDVETAIYSLVTRSANDSATALAEMLGGSEQAFARMMTAKARALGMSGTTFKNAHGLPNSDQKSTARDLALLGIALKEHYPREFKYFSTRSFTYGRTRIGNHNRLLGKIEGVDGIKTGYTRASGFNLASSVQSGDRRIVAVVLGGASSSARDNQMAELIKRYLPRASTRGGGQLIARTSETPTLASPVASMLPKRNAPTPDSRPRKGVIVALSEQEVLDAESAQMAQQTVIETEETTMPVMQAYAAPIPAPIRRPKVAVDPINTASTSQRASKSQGGWAVQVASSPSEEEARGMLARTTEKAPTVLASASPFTMQFEKSGTTYYRARFGGFETKTAAWNACDVLKKKKIACYAVQQ
ncbi:D-alanyl-D-alanine carboxypeptidase [Mesorhizobium sp. NBSH29]|nr:D-alanyl-D-alanine carboxypeptidase [Mesorhizobium sp. NBSH29]QPC88703.1 D-alanyl-D-alanine carboxypeptidase [Mesorhizobium sp. NBSH29]